MNRNKLRLKIKWFLSIRVARVWGSIAKDRVDGRHLARLEMKREPF